MGGEEEELQFKSGTGVAVKIKGHPKDARHGREEGEQGSSSLLP